MFVPTFVAWGWRWHITAKVMDDTAASIQDRLPKPFPLDVCETKFPTRHRGEVGGGIWNITTLNHPWSLTWNLKISPWKRRFLLEIIIFRFYVKLRGCYTTDWKYMCGNEGKYWLVVFLLLKISAEWDSFGPWWLQLQKLRRYDESMNTVVKQEWLAIQ